MSDSKLTEKQAYFAMFAFLEAQYAVTKSDDIGSLLGSMAVLADGQPADPALQSDWGEAIARSLSGQVNARWSSEP